MRYLLIILSLCFSYLQAATVPLSYTLEVTDVNGNKLFETVDYSLTDEIIIPERVEVVPSGGNGVLLLYGAPGAISRNLYVIARLLGGSELGFEAQPGGSFFRRFSEDQFVDDKPQVIEVDVDEFRLSSNPVFPPGKSGRLVINYEPGVIDPEAPIIRHTFREGIRYRGENGVAHRTFAVQVIDNNEFVMELRINDELIVSSNQEPNIVPVTFREGLNKVDIKATNSLGKTTEINFDKIVLDTTGPTFFIDQVDNIVTNNARFDISGTIFDVNPQGYDIFVNGQRRGGRLLTVSDSRVIASVPLELGNNTISIIARDDFSNRSTYTLNNIFYAQVGEPGIILSSSSGFTTNDSAYNLEASIEGNGVVTTQVFLNNNLFLTTTDRNINTPLILAEGMNTIRLVSTDENMSASELEVDNIFLDTIDPLLSWNSPQGITVGTSEYNVDFNIIDSSEVVSRLFLNDILVETVNVKTFTETYSLEPGANVFRVEISDAAGNEISTLIDTIFYDNLAPVVTVNPGNDHVFKGNDPQIITASITDETPINYDSLRIVLNGSFLNPDLFNVDTSTGLISISLDDTQPLRVGDNRLDIVLGDSLGNSGNTRTMFVFEEAVQTEISLVPESNSSFTNIITQQIRVNYSGIPGNINTTSTTAKLNGVLIDSTNLVFETDHILVNTDFAFSDNQFEINIVNDSGDIFTQSATYNVQDTLAPTAIFEPTSGTEFSVENFTIQVVVSDNLSGLNPFNIQVLNRGEVLASNSFFIDDQTINIVFNNSNELGQGFGDLEVRFEDLAGNSNSIIGSFSQANEFDAPIITEVNPFLDTFSIVNPRLVFFYDEQSNIVEESLKVILNGEAIPENHYNIDPITQNIFVNLSDVYFLLESSMNVLDIELSDEFGNIGNSSFTYSATLGPKISHALTYDTQGLVTGVHYEIQSIEPIDYSQLELKFNGVLIPNTSPNVSVNTLVNSIDLNISEGLLADNRRNYSSISISNTRNQVSFKEFSFDNNLRSNMEFTLNGEEAFESVYTRLQRPSLKVNYFDTDEIDYNSIIVKINEQIIDSAHLQTSAIDKQTEVLFDDNLELIDDQNNVVVFEYKNVDGRSHRDNLIIQVDTDKTAPVVSIFSTGEVILDDLTKFTGNIFDNVGINENSLQFFYINTLGEESLIPESNLSITDRRTVGADIKSLDFEITVNDSFVIDTEGNIQIKVVVSDTVNNEVIASGDFFEIVPPTSAITSPVALEISPSGPQINTLSPIITIADIDPVNSINFSTVVLTRNGERIPSENITIDTSAGIVTITFASNFRLLPGIINTIQMRTLSDSGIVSFVSAEFAAPKESNIVLADTFPPIVESSPISGTTFDNEEQTVLISFLEQNQVDYRRLEIILNGEEVDESYYEVNQFTNIVELHFERDRVLREGLNALTIRIGDTFGNNNIENIIFTLNSNEPIVVTDNQAPIINFSPNKGKVETLEPIVRLSFADQSLINFSSLEVKMNGDLLESSQINISPSFNRAELLDILLTDNEITTIEVSISDIHGNNKVSKLIFDTRDFSNDGFVAVSSSSNTLDETTCVVVGGGLGKCWGLKTLGRAPINGADVDFGNQVEVDQVIARVLENEALLDFSPRKILKFATGDEQICMLLDSGDVNCWGNVKALGHDVFLTDSSGYYGDTSSEVLPVRANLPARAKDIVAINGTVCALLQTGTVNCWGKNNNLFGNGFVSSDNTELVNAYYGDDEAVLEQVGLSGLAEKIRSNGEAICASIVIDEKENSIECWGRQSVFNGSIGIFGNQTEFVGVNGVLPNQVGNIYLGETETIKDFSMSGSSICALTNSEKVYCWGENFYGELGLETTNTNISFEDSVNNYGPISIDSVGIKKIIGSSEFSNYCALYTSGSVKCWGDSSQGATGNENPDNNIGDEVNELSQLANIDLGGAISRDVFEVTGGFCSNNSNGTMMCWGVSYPLNRISTTPEQELFAVIGDEPGEMPPPLSILDSSSLVDPDSALFSTIASLNSDIEEGIIPLDVNFSSEDINVASYTWNFGDGSPVITNTTSQIAHTYTEAGGYIAELTVNYTDGTTRTAQKIINVNNPNIKPTPILVAGGLLLGPPPYEVSFNGFMSFDADGIVENYIWDFGNGDTLTTQTPETTYTFNEIGDFLVTLSVEDNEGAITKSFPIVVNVRENTALIGRVLDANTGADGIVTPIEGVVVNVLGTSLITTTDADGNFRLDGIVNPQSIIIDFNTDNTVGSTVYAGFREGISLEEGEENVISRPFFLPQIETNTAETIDPDNTVTVQNTRLGISLEIAPNSARNADGSLFLGDLTISEVPVDLAPVTLPRGTRPEVLITVQPVAIFFDPPAKISFPNTSGIPANQEFPLTQINPFTGEFDEIGVAQVTLDGQRIVTVEGGTRYSSWGGVTVMPYESTTGDSNNMTATGGEAQNPPKSPVCQSDQCKPIAENFGSRLDENSGSLSVEHKIASYKSLNVDQSLTLTYNSLRANIKPIITKTFKTPPVGSNGAFHILSGVLNGKIPNDTCEAIGSVVECRQDALSIGSKAFETIHSFEEEFATRNPETRFIAGTYIDANDFTTGVYPYEISMAYKPEADSSQLSSIFSPGKVAIVNKRNSYFGAGWSLNELDQIFEQDNGDILYVHGGEGETIFTESSDLLGLKMRFFDTRGRGDRIDELVSKDFAGTNIVDFRIERQNPSERQRINNPILRETSSEFNISNIDFVRANYGKLLHVGRNNSDDTFGNENPKADDLLISPLSSSKSEVSYGAIFEGHLKVPENGDVEFKIKRAIGQSIKLVVNEKTIIEVSGNNLLSNMQGIIESSGIATNLTKGSASIKLVVGSSADSRLLKLTASGAGLPDFGGFPIPKEYFSTKPFRDDDQKVYLSNSSTFDQIIKDSQGKYKRILRDGMVYNFDSDGFLLEKKDLNNNSYLFSYDSERRINQILDPVGLATSFEYSNGKLSKIVLPDLRETNFTHSSGNLIAIQDPDLSNRSFVYDGDSKLKEQVSKRGFKTTYTYNHLDRLIKAEKPRGIVNQAIPYQGVSIPNKSLNQGTFENPFIITKELSASTQTTDALGRVSSKRLNARGFTNQVTNSKGEITRYTRNPDNLITSSIDARGHETLFSYDVNGNQVSIEQPDGVISFTAVYNHTFNKIKTSIDSKGVETTNTFDDKGNILSTSRSNGLNQSFTYNSKGQVKTITNSNNETTTFFFNSKFNLEKVVDFNNKETIFTYDEAGNLASSTDSNGHVSSFEYDNLNRISKSSDARGFDTLFTYDEKGNLKTVQDSLFNLTSYNYDESDNVIAVTDPNNKTEIFVYDLKNLLKTHRDRNANVISYEYDELDRLKEKTGATNVIYDYDEVGNLISIKDDINHIYYSYDLNNRLVNESVSGFSPSHSFEYSYSDAGERTSLKSSLGVQQYTYNVRNELESIRSFSGRNFLMNYDNQSRLKGIGRDSGVNSTFNYDLAGRLVGVNHGAISFHYTLDEIGNRTLMEQSRLQPGLFNQSVNYTYDQANQLKTAGASLVASSSEVFNYDGTGNRLGNTIDNGNRLSEDDNFTYEYDNNGNMSKKVSKTSSEQFVYTYDIENRLLSLQSPSQLVVYTYDALGRRVGKKVGTQEYKYLYDGENILMEYLNANLIRSYVHAPGADNQIGFRDELIPKDYEYLKDGLGSVTDIIDGSSGELFESYAYKSFGETKVFDKDGNEKTQPSQIFGYTGREMDIESDLYYYRARYYSPRTGRFISEDPIGFNGEDFNLYRYVGNNPVNSKDPSGLRSPAVSACLAFIAAGSIYDAYQIIDELDKKANELKKKINKLKKEKEGCLKSSRRLEIQVEILRLTKEFEEVDGIFAQLQHYKPGTGTILGAVGCVVAGKLLR